MLLSPACLSKRLAKGIFDAPAGGNSLDDGRRCESVSIRPACNSKAIAVEGDYSIISLVPALFSCGCPSAVARLVIAVYINAIKGVLGGWPWTHIGFEIRKPISSKPSVANGNSTTAVAWVCCTFSVEAPVFHPRPAPILKTTNSTVSSFFGCRKLPLEASATPGVLTVSQAPRRDRYRRSALTLAKPQSTPVMVYASPVSWCESAKSLIFEFKNHTNNHGEVISICQYEMAATKPKPQGKAA